MLNRSYILFTVFFFNLVSLNAQEYVVRGKVLDKNTNKPLAFVNIVVNNERNGTVTDIDGKFRFVSKEPVKTLKLSYIGYNSSTYTITPNDDLHHLVIYLKPSKYELEEVTVFPGENPAHRIIKQVTANRSKNNPERLSSFSYTSYNKMIFTGDYDSTYYKDMSKRQTLDSNNQKALEFFDKRHLMLMEFVSNRKFMAPGRNHEEVIASRVSGLQNPGFAMLATQLQSFSFYTDFISIYDKEYLNPITKGSTKKYLFIIEDTTWTVENDTVFLISFQPKRGKNFEGMKGMLYINSSGYALQNVIAEPHDKSGGIDVKIQQKYEKVGGQWFPVQLNTDIIYKTIKLDSVNVKGIGRSYLDSIKINPELSKKDFNAVALEVKEDAHKQDGEIWKSHRVDTLNEKEISTYHYIDSIGKEEKLDQKLKTAETLLNGYLPVKFINLELDKILNYNEYEGFRAGSGIHTNEKLSRFFSIGGYGAYGFRDKTLKYGSNLTFFLYRPAKLKAGFAYSNDVMESGGTDLPFNNNPFSSENYRKYLVKNMFQRETYKGSLGFHTLRYLDLRFSLSQNNITSTDEYRFSYAAEGLKSFYPITLYLSGFNTTEATIAFRYAYKEKFYKIGTSKVSLGTKYPVVKGRVTRGMQLLFSGFFDYTKYDLSVEKSFRLKNAGNQSWRISGGFIDRDLPYALLYNGRGNFANYGIFADYSFQTMRMNEFLSDRFVHLFFKHDFGKLLFRTKKFEPELAIIHNAGFGTLRNADLHRNITFKTMDHGFFETGLVINNLLRMQFYGLGIGAFYRYGAYSYADPMDNLALKFSFKWGL